RMFAAGLHRFAYRHIAKPIFFRRDPETVHDAVVRFGKTLGRASLARRITALLFQYAHPMLEQEILGIHFPNPVGLTAGFDKNAELTRIVPSVGFGFAEVGSITGEPCEGNPKPRLWRLPKSQGLMVYYGLKNDGCEAIARRLAEERFEIPIGISVAKTNSAETIDTQAGIADYRKAFQTLEPLADYLTVNISCPNAFGGEPFTAPERLELLLRELETVPTAKPVFLKMPVDLGTEAVDALVAVAARHRVHGLILANLTKRRDHPAIHQTEIQGLDKGGISGKPMYDPSNELLAHLFQTVGSRFVLIGSGGVFSAEDAYEKIRRGASLIQLATGMIFQGPQLIGEINRGLVALLCRDGFFHIREAVGSGCKKGVY
ncbi:MAG: quinone-dependent dihydroorotate dehydrogenase, partial [Patescibacteria group bacterium]